MSTFHAVKSPLPADDRPPSASTEDVRKILLSEAAGSDNISGPETTVWQNESSNRSAVFIIHYRGATESLLSGNITNWHGSSQPGTGRLYRTSLVPPEGRSLLKFSAATVTSTRPERGKF